MSYCKNLIRQKFIEPYLHKSTECIGVELEYPLIYKDVQLNTQKIILDLFKHLKDNYEFKDDKLDMYDNPLSVKNEIGDTIKLEGRYEIIEFAMQKDLNINCIAKRFFKYFTIVQKFLKSYNCFLTGMGSNLVDCQEKIHLVESDFTYAIHDYIRKYTFYKNPNFFLTNMQSIQTHLEVPMNSNSQFEGENLLKALNLFSKLDFVRAILFSNSLPNEFSIPRDLSYSKDLLCFRDFNWKHAGFPDTGSVNTVFKSLDELINYFSNLKLYFKRVKNHYKAFKGPNIADYFKDEQQNDDVLCVFRYLKNVALNSYATLEIRSDCTQPLIDTFSPVAFHLGLLQRINEAIELTDRFFQDNKVQYSNSTLRLMAINDIEIVNDNFMRRYLYSLYNLSRQALMSRGFGEEKYLLCLEKRIERLECPAKIVKKQLITGVSLNTIIEQCSVLKMEEIVT